MTEFPLGARALFESEQGGCIVVMVAAVTTWLEEFQPPVEYVVHDGDGTLFTVQPEQLRLLAECGE